MSKIGKQAWVSGRVQGVSYRAHAEEKARTLGLTGWVCNLDDGRVMLKVFGPEEHVNVLVEWLWEGSPAASVDEVEVSGVAFEELAEFKALQNPPTDS
jgi:acylphosphatase